MDIEIKSLRKCVIESQEELTTAMENEVLIVEGKEMVEEQRDKARQVQRKKPAWNVSHSH